MRTEERFRTLFRSSPDSYVVRKSCGKADPISDKVEAKYVTVRRVLSDAAIAAHLAGETCLVLKPDLRDGTCVWGALDHDIYKDPEKLARIAERVHLLKLQLHLFPSKSGGLHSFKFFQDPQTTNAVRAELHEFANLLGDPKAEVFPKVVSKGKLPYGIAMPFYGDAEGFKQFNPVPQPLSSNSGQPLPPDINEPIASYGLQLRANANFADLIASKLNIQIRQVDGGTSYDYHGIVGKGGQPQPCLIQGTVHESQSGNPRQARFLVKDGHIIHQCFDSDCQSVNVSKTKHALKVLDLEDVLSRPLITVAAGEYPKAMDDAEQVLLPSAERLGIFQRAGELVRVIRLANQLDSLGLIRPQGTLMLEPMNILTMLKTFERLMDFQSLRRDPQGPPIKTRINCPNRIAATYLVSKGEWLLPVLVGSIAAPVMRVDGTVLQQPGFDRLTGLFLNSEETWPAMNEKPTVDDAREALATLKAPFAEFPFLSAADRSVVLAAILTALQRRLLGPCPLFAFSAPTQRSGKTLLAEAVAIIATGREAPGTEMSPDKEELRKSLFATLREGQQVINLDNIEHAVKSPTLAKIITGSEHEDRVLGESKTLKLPTNCCWTCTGNNLTFRGDMTVRVLRCRIDAKLERPEKREFSINDLKTHLKENRIKLVVAALTLLRAFKFAGEPKQKVDAWGGFEGWSKAIREPLIWTGEADPCDTRAAAIEEDPEAESIYELLAALREHFGDRSFELKEVEENSNKQGQHGNSRFPILRAALANVAGEGRNFDRRKLGWWMRNSRDRIVNGLQLVRANSAETHPARWRVNLVQLKLKN
jgi:hypothetical protein